MEKETILHLIDLTIGLIFLIGHRKIGKLAVKNQKRYFGKFFPSDTFDQSLVVILQIGFLFVGLLIVFISISGLFK